MFGLGVGELVVLGIGVAAPLLFFGGKWALSKAQANNDFDTALSHVDALVASPEAQKDAEIARLANMIGRRIMENAYPLTPGGTP